MSRKVRCKVTKELGRSDEFYCVELSNRREYYKNKEVYDGYLKRKEDRQSLYNYIGNEFFYGQVIPPIFLKKMNEVDLYGYDIILKTFQYKKDAFDYAMSVNFSNDFQKSAYIIAVLKNLINEVAKRVKIEERTLLETKKEKVDIGLFNIDDSKTEARDISGFFDEEDLF